MFINLEVYKKLKATGNCKRTGIQVDEAEHRVVMHFPYKGWHSFSKTFIHMMDQASTLVKKLSSPPFFSLFSSLFLSI